jgi:hypothetical protein
VGFGRTTWHAAETILARRLSADPKAYVAWLSTATDCFRNPQRPLNLRRGNRFSCPEAAVPLPSGYVKTSPLVTWDPARSSGEGQVLVYTRLVCVMEHRHDRFSVRDKCLGR